MLTIHILILPVPLRPLVNLGHYYIRALPKVLCFSCDTSPSLSWPLTSDISLFQLSIWFSPLLITLPLHLLFIMVNPIWSRQSSQTLSAFVSENQSISLCLIHPSWQKSSMIKNFLIQHSHREPLSMQTCFQKEPRQSWWDKDFSLLSTLSPANLSLSIHSPSTT